MGLVREIDHHDDNAELLGKDQWDWLEKTFDKVEKAAEKEHTLLVFVSSVQVLSRGRQRFGVENWDQYPKDLERLYNRLKNITTTFEPQILSGDVHFAEAR